MKTHLQNSTAGELQSWSPEPQDKDKLKLPHLSEGGAD
jgi:hypothetical protein